MAKDSVKLKTSYAVFQPLHHKHAALLLLAQHSPQYPPHQYTMKLQSLNSPANCAAFAEKLVDWYEAWHPARHSSLKERHRRLRTPGRCMDLKRDTEEI